MRLLASLILGTLAFALTACGGKVIVDGFNEGVGGAGGGGVGGAGGAPTVTSSSSSTVVSSTVSSTSSGAVCPAELAISASCDVEGMTCSVSLACCGGSAVCKNGFWQFLAKPCNSACTGPCGPDKFACQAGAVCVAYIGKSTTYECRPKPCPGPLACGCASPLCAEQEMVCSNIQDGFKVLCDCKGQC